MTRLETRSSAEPFARRATTEMPVQDFMTADPLAGSTGDAAPLNPNQVKQREHVGIGAMVSGALFILIGLGVLFVSWPVAALAITFGLIALVGGGAILTRIPDMLSYQRDERA